MLITWLRLDRGGPSSVWNFTANQVTLQVVVAAEHEVPEHARVSLCRQAQQVTSLSDDELEYASASSPAQVATSFAQA